jgi:SAM-dependent methyltransferase
MTQLSASSKTIRDFGEQWCRYPDNDGYYGSVKLLGDIFGPLLPLSTIKDSRVADIGSGTGRIVNMLLDAGAKEVVAIEPSAAFEVLKQNTSARSGRIVYIHGTGEDLPSNPPVDLVSSIGVLHHVECPQPIVSAAYRALKPGGRIVIWLYGREGNEAYLRIIVPLRRITTRLPHAMLAWLARLLNLGVDLYLIMSRFFPLPLRGYVKQVLSKFTREQRFLAIYDQLNPEFAKYYTEYEARELLECAGFVEVSLHHRHGYSWTVIGTRPGEQGPNIRGISES